SLAAARSLLVGFFKPRGRKTYASYPGQTGARRPAMRDFSRSSGKERTSKKLAKKERRVPEDFLDAGTEKNKSLPEFIKSVTRRRVFLDTFRTKHSSSFKESSKEMFPAQNSSTLLARRTF